MKCKSSQLPPALVILTRYAQKKENTYVHHIVSGSCSVEGLKFSAVFPDVRLSLY